MLIGNGPTDLNRISMVGNDLALDDGIGTCGKNGQGVPVGVGQPTLRLDRITSAAPADEAIPPDQRGSPCALVQADRRYAAILLVFTAAKAAIAEPYYVPSGSMEPTLQIGDELLATKFPYGYSSASLPPFIACPQTQRILAALPHRGDIVVFRWPGDRSQIWVKRVIGLPGDRIALRNGRVWINGAPVGSRPTGRSGGSRGRLAEPVARFTETLPGDRPTRSSTRQFRACSTTCPKSSSRPTTFSSWATIATIRRTAGLRSVTAASVCCRSTTWSAASKPWSDRGISAVARQLVWTWPAGLRLSRFFTAVQ